jgi:hypothetical protein
MGIERCRLRARTSVWWPGISKETEKMVQNCTHYASEKIPCKESLMPTKLPNYPWQKFGTDLFNLNGTTYLLASDYFSRFSQVIKLNTITSASVITALLKTWHS